MIRLQNISFDHCIKCTVCTVYCPVARATHHFPGPKQSGPDTERLRIKSPELLDESLKYCTNCKRCEIACPSNVKIADIIQSSKWRYFKKSLRPRDFFLAHTDLMGSVATRASLLVNFFIKLPPVKLFLDLFFRIPSERRFPKYARGSFLAWYKKHRAEQEAFAERAVYFPGCYVNYNNHELGKDVVTVLNAMNIGVIVSYEKCCGVPLIANGYIDRARKNALLNINSLAASAAESGARIISASSSCSFALKHEYRNLLELDNSAIFDSLDYITRFIHERFLKGNLPELKPVRLRAAYHSPCHLERMGGVMNTIEVLKKIPGLDLTILHSECCGIAGTYGFKKEYYKVSQKVGAELFKRIERADPQIVITDCETCKWQIEMSTPYRVEHPVTVLARSIDGGKL